jgi:transcription antitermination factor NusG
MEKDGKTWVVVQLNEFGEVLAERDELRRKIEKLFPGKEIFIPYSKVEFKGRVTKLNVIEGYIFIESGLEEKEYFALSELPFIDNILHTSSNRGMNLNTIRNGDVEKLKDNLQKLIVADLELGMKVFVNSGVYRGIEGEVVGFTEDKKSAFVYIELRTLKAIRAIPTYILDIQGGDDV